MGCAIDGIDQRVINLRLPLCTERAVVPIMYKLHHIGLFCHSMAASLAFYETILQHQQIARFHADGEYNYAFLSTGGDFLLELMAAPFADSERAFIDEHGYTFHHLAFAVPDLDAAYAQLKAAGLKFVWEPDDFLFVRHFGVFDDCGNVVEILQENDPLPAPDSQRAFPYQLHHACLLSDDWERTTNFYATHFGLHIPFPATQDHGRKSIYLADPAFHPRKHNCLIKVLGALLQTEESAETIPTIDHNAYVVIDVRSAFQTAVDAGATPIHAPYADSETDIAWLRDNEGNSLALMG